jgi:hypothetical protein
MLSAVSRAYGVDVELATFFTDATIEGLAEALRNTPKARVSLCRGALSGDELFAPEKEDGVLARFGGEPGEGHARECRLGGGTVLPHFHHQQPVGG